MVCADWPHMPTRMPDTQPSMPRGRTVRVAATHAAARGFVATQLPALPGDAGLFKTATSPRLPLDLSLHHLCLTPTTRLSLLPLPWTTGARHVVLPAGPWPPGTHTSAAGRRNRLSAKPPATLTTTPHTTLSYPHIFGLFVTTCRGTEQRCR